MNILLRQVKIADTNSTHNGLTKDILITDGSIVAIKDSIEADALLVETEKGIVSPGWVDVFAHFCDPGFEYRETLESGAAAAAAGGFTRVFALPNTNPVIHNKSQVEYIARHSQNLGITVHPLGAITKNAEGKELAEMYDMQNSGAIAFTDGIHPVQSAGLFLKALQYVKAFNGTVIQVPIDKSIGEHGLMHEGIISTQMGLPGIPAMAEELIIARDIKLARYADSRLHFTGVTSAKSLEYIKRGKDAGLNITCSVTPYHLFFCDEDLKDYDTNLKVNPPLRSRSDMMALRTAVLNGLVDCIATHHLPQNWDAKTIEFEYAKNGMIGLQTAYAALNTVLPELSSERISSLLSLNARKIFGLPDAAIEEGREAEITIFNNNAFILTKENINSKSLNSPFINTSLHGQVTGIIAKGKITLNK